MTLEQRSLDEYVPAIVSFKGVAPDRRTRATLLLRFEKALSLVPEEVLHLFLSGSRHLTVSVMADTALPLGMATRTEGPPGKRRYTIVSYLEHAGWPEDRFIGAFLRELGHVVAQRPREEEWPVARGDRARFKEKLEHRADALVWQWGLRHYSMSYLATTFPEHWVERIVVEIEKTLLEKSSDKG
jgi:hypothetical protein